MPKPTDTVVIELPEELFGPDAKVLRKKPLKMRHVQQVGLLQERGSASAFGELRKRLAEIYPKWKNVKDPETGETLGNPGEDPDVFLEIEPMQWRWLAGQGLVERPIKQRSTT